MKALKKHYEAVSAFDTTLYQAIRLWEEIWDPEWQISKPEERPVKCLTEREVRSLVAVLERHIKESYTVKRIGQWFKSSGKRIREGRVHRGWSQDELASYLGVQRTTVVDWESGRCKPAKESYDKMAEMFGWGD